MVNFLEYGQWQPRSDSAGSSRRPRFDRWREEQYLKVSKYPFPVDRLIWLSKHGAFWRRLQRNINFHQPDIAIAFLPSAIVGLGMIKPNYSIRRIASLHNVPERNFCDPARWDPNPFDRRRRMSSLAKHHSKIKA